MERYGDREQGFSINHSSLSLGLFLSLTSCFARSVTGIQILFRNHMVLPVNNMAALLPNANTAGAGRLSSHMKTHVRTFFLLIFIMHFRRIITGLFCFYQNISTILMFFLLIIAMLPELV